MRQKQRVNAPGYHLTQRERVEVSGLVMTLVGVYEAVDVWAGAHVAVGEPGIIVMVVWLITFILVWWRGSGSFDMARNVVLLIAFTLAAESIRFFVCVMVMAFVLPLFHAKQP